MNEKSYFSIVLTQQSATFSNGTTYYPYPPLEWYDTFPEFQRLASRSTWDGDAVTGLTGTWDYVRFVGASADHQEEFVAGCEAFGEECE